jgi:hypothetical protein
MISRRLAGRVLLAVGVVGLVASLGGIVVGRRLINEMDAALGRSLQVTAESVEALQASVALAEETTVLVSEGLGRAEATTRELRDTFEQGSQLLEGTADLTEDRIAGSLEAVEESLPSLIQVAAVIDRTLSALSALPLGPRYNPDEPFDESLREVQRSLAGVPDDLRVQAALIREAGANLREVGEGTDAIAGDLAAITGGLEQAVEILRSYTATATSARDLVVETQEGLGFQVGLARLLVTLLGLTLATGQVVPLALGWTLLQPVEGGRRLLRDDVPVAEPPKGSERALRD